MESSVQIENNRCKYKFIHIFRAEWREKDFGSKQRGGIGEIEWTYIEDNVQGPRQEG